MAWTSTSEVVTSAKLNAGTAAGVATTAGGLFVATGANAIAERVPAGDIDTGSGSGTNTSYLSLANLTGGTAFSSEVEVTVATGTQALVMFSSSFANATGGSWCVLSYAISGASSQSASDDRACHFESSAANDQAQFGSFYLHGGLNAGSNTFTLQAKVSAGTGTFSDPRIFVLPL